MRYRRSGHEAELSGSQHFLLHVHLHPLPRTKEPVHVCRLLKGIARTAVANWAKSHSKPLWATRDTFAAPRSLTGSTRNPMLMPKTLCGNGTSPQRRKMAALYPLWLAWKFTMSETRTETSSYRRSSQPRPNMLRGGKCQSAGETRQLRLRMLLLLD